MKMKHSMQRLGLWLMICFLQHSNLAAAQASSGATQTAAPSAQQETQLMRYATTAPVPDVIELGVRIQDAYLQINLGTNQKQTEAQLNQIWLELATRVPYFQQASTLAVLAHARTAFYLKREDYAAADAAARASFLTSAHPLVTKDPSAFVAASPMQLSEAKQARDELEPLQELRRKLAKQGMIEEDRLRGIVEQAYEFGDFKRLIQIGEAGFDYLAALILKDVDGFPLAGQEPIAVLLQINKQRAGGFVAANFHRGGLLWKRRMLLIMQEYEVLLGHNKADNNSSESWPSFPDWVDVLRMLIATPEMAAEALELAGRTLRPGAAYAPMRKTLLESIQTYGEPFLARILELHPRGSAPHEDFLFLGVQAKSTEVRRITAEKLASMGTQAPMDLVAVLLQDPDPLVRKTVAQLYRLSGPFEGKAWENLITLSRDEDAELRALAATRMTHSSSAFPPADYRRLARDPNPKVVAQLVENLPYRLADLGAELAGELALTLAQSEAPEVRVAVDKLIMTTNYTQARAPLLAALRERLFGESEFHVWQDLLNKLVYSSYASQELGAWILEADKAMFARLTERTNCWEPGGLLDSKYLSIELRRALLLRAELEGMDVVLSLYQNRKLRDQNFKALAAIVQDGQVSRAIRVACASSMASVGGGDGREDMLVSCLRTLIGASAWRTSPPSELELHQLGLAVASLDADKANALILSAVESKSVPDEVAACLAQKANSQRSSYTPMVLPILRRWFDPSSNSPQVSTALAGAFRLGDQVPRDLLYQALKQPAYVRPVVSAMAVLHFEEFTDVLGASLLRQEHEQIAPGGEYPSAQELVPALESIGSDAAAEYLLAGLHSEQLWVQALCAAALDSIEARRARFARWSDGLLQRPSRGAALRELLEMLSAADPLVRALAVRGVGAFGAVEYIPTLIAMLKDPSAEVREAVVEAVKQLARTPALPESRQPPAQQTEKAGSK